MKGRHNFLYAVLLLGAVCSCSQKEGTSPTPVNSTVPVSAVILNPTSLTLIEGESGTITATVSPSNADNRKVIWSSSDASVATVSDGKVSGISKGSAIITATADDNGKSAQCSVTVNAKSGGDGPGGGGSGSGNPIEAVDLGLSVKWANMNLGATAIEGSGDYYAWGEVKTKDYYSWSNYLWCNGSKTTLTKYNTQSSNGIVDNKIILDAEDDVAHVKLGGEWRTPTKAEWDELDKECIWEWTTYNLVPGYLIISEINGNRIFLPASGYWDDSERCYFGERLRYQSSSLYVGGPELVWVLDGLVTSNGYRNCGRPVRAVFGAPTKTTEITITVSKITATVYRVSTATDTTDPYYVGIAYKSDWDELGGDYICDFYINDDLKSGTLNDMLCSAESGFDLRDLSSKTGYVIFATYCDYQGVRKGEIYTYEFWTE